MITCRARKQNEKADALTRRPGDRPRDAEKDERLRYQEQVLLPPDRFVQCPIYEPESLEEMIVRKTQNDQFCQAILTALRHNDLQFKQLTLTDCREDQGRLRYREKI